MKIEVIRMENEEQKKDYVWTNGGFAVDGNDIWFVPYWENVLCKYSMDTRRMEKMVCFPEMSVTVAGSFNVKKNGEYIIVVPAFEKNLYIYNQKENLMKKFELKKRKYVAEKFNHCVSWGKNVYLFPIAYGRILKIDLKNELISEIEIPKFKDSAFVDCTSVKNKVYLVDMTNSIFIFDMENETIKTYNLGGEERKYRTIAAIADDEFGLSDMTGKIYIINIKEKRENQYNFDDVSIFDNSVCVGDEWFLFPFEDDRPVIKFNTTCFKVEKIYFNEKKHFKQWYANAFSKTVVYNKKIYVMNTYQRCLYVLDEEGNQIEHFFIEMGEMDDDILYELYKCGQKQGGIYEGTGDYATLEYLFSRIKDVSDMQKQNCNCIGKNIYNELVNAEV